MKAIKVRLYPTIKQKQLIDKTIGCCRFIYNQMLNERIAFYQAHKDDKETLKSHKYKTEKEYKVDFEFLKEVSSRALQQARNDLISAYSNFFKRKKGFPKFKSKHKSKLNYRDPQVGNQIRFENKKLNMPKLGYLKIRGLSNSFSGNIKSVTVIKRKDGKFEASILTDTETTTKDNKPRAVGIDLGLKSFVTLSNGVQIDLPSVTELDKKIIKQQKHFSRKTKGSNRREKCRIKLASLNQQRTDKLLHFYRHLANLICSENQTIKIENLNVSGMMKNRKLARKIQSVSWSKFIAMLKQKALEYGSSVIEVDRFFPSSKLCSCCGSEKEDLKLSDRVYTCEKCGLTIDRDLNASLNIKNYKSDELSDYKHGETVNLVKKFFDFNTSCFSEVFTQPITKCYVC